MCASPVANGRYCTSAYTITNNVWGHIAIIDLNRTLSQKSTSIYWGDSMAWKLKYRCNACGYEAEVYEGRGLFRQQITPMSCPDCKTIQNIVVGGIIADVAPSYRSEVGRLCLQCGSDNIRIWDMKTCPKCQGEMEDTGEREFWT